MKQILRFIICWHRPIFLGCICPGPFYPLCFERLVEGIQDYEKVRILKEELKNQPEKLRLLDETLNMFEIGRLAEEPAADMVNKAREVINGF